MNTFNEELFKDRVAIVTGATTNNGIGMGIAKSLAELGAKVYALGLDAELTTVEEGLDIEVIEFDVTDYTKVDQFIDSLNQLDILIHGAGVAWDNQYDFDVYSKTMDINVNSAFYMTNKARHLLADSDNGNILFISSMYAIFGSDMNPAYAASKGAINQLTKSLAIEYAKDGVRVNSIAPGFIDTPLMDHIPDEVEEEIVKTTPLKRLGQTNETGETVTFLCSPAASFITGTIIPVDGGYSIWKN